MPHVRTVPLLSKEDPVNKGKPYDIKIQDVTIDVKPFHLSLYSQNISTTRI